MMRRKLLFVHNSQTEIIKIASFMNQAYVVFSVDTPKNALDIIERYQVDMVFANIELLAPDGSNLLTKIKESHPDIIRIILSEKEDDQSIISALNKNIAKTCIFKPWNNEKILLFIHQIFDAEKKLEEAKLHSSIFNLTELPSIKTSYQNILHLIDNDSEIDDIVESIETDPAISAKILRVANSAYYGVRTASIKQAFMYLGFKNIRDLVLSSSIFDIFNANDLPDRIFQPYWQQAFVTSKIIHTIYKMLGRKVPDFATSAGVLINIGIVFFLKSFTEKYIELIHQIKQNDCEESKVTLEILEKESFGITHSLAGGYLLNWWGMPFQIVEAALYHHTPLSDSVTHKEYMSIVHIAEYYSAKLLNYETHGIFDEQTLVHLGITKSDIEKALSNVLA